MPTHVERVAVFGDSQTLGLGVEPGEGWVQRLHARYDEANAELRPASRAPRVFYELGLYAAKAENLATSIPLELPVRFRLFSESREGYDRTKRLSIITVGGNDAYVRRHTNENITPMSDFSRQIGRIARTAIEQGEVLYVGIPPCDEDRRSRFKGIVAAPQGDSRIAYENEAVRIFKEVGARTVPLAEEGYSSPEYMMNLTDDGVHGTRMNEDWIFKRVVPHFDDIVGIKTLFLEGE